MALRRSSTIPNVWSQIRQSPTSVSYTHLRAHETVLDLVCRLLLEKKTDDIKWEGRIPVSISTVSADNVWEYTCYSHEYTLVDSYPIM